MISYSPIKSSSSGKFIYKEKYEPIKPGPPISPFIEKYSPIKYKSLKIFKHKLPQQRLKDIIEKYGKPYKIDKKHGVVIWKNLKGIYNMYQSIVMLDEEILHCSPKKHYDFLYFTIKVYIPDKLLCDVLFISQSIYYDRLKNLLTVRCHFSGANVSTIWLALKIALGEKTLKESESKKTYGKTISATADDKSYEDKLEKENYRMIKKLNKLKPVLNKC